MLVQTAWLNERTVQQRNALLVLLGTHRVLAQRVWKRLLASRAPRDGIAMAQGRRAQSVQRARLTTIATPRRHAKTACQGRLLPKMADLAVMDAQLVRLDDMPLRVVPLALNVLLVRLIMTRTLLRPARIAWPAKLHPLLVGMATASIVLRANTLQRERPRASIVFQALSMKMRIRQRNARNALLVRSPTHQGRARQMAAQHAQSGDMQQQAQRPASAVLRARSITMVTRLLHASFVQLGHTRMVQTLTPSALNAAQARQIRTRILQPYAPHAITGNTPPAAERSAQTVPSESTTTIW